MLNYILRVIIGLETNMKIQKSQVITIGLLITTVILIGAIIFIGAQLSNEDVQKSQIAPVKTKAQATSYNKLLAVNQTSSVSPTSVPTNTPIPTPTETILVKTATPSMSLTPTSIASLSGTLTPTKTKTLPKTGVISNTIMIFGAAGLLVFFSLIF